MASAATIEENKRVVRRFPEEVATHGNLDVIDEICAEEIIDHSPLGEMQGRGELKEQARYLLSAFGDLSATVEDIIAEGDTVAMRVTLRGIHEGEFMGIEPTGKEFEFQNMVFARVRGGKVTERWVRPDQLGLMQQLGVVEPPGDPSSQRTMETVTSADGTPIAYERTGSGPPLVLVHGTGLDHRFWDLSGVRSALAEHYTVYAIDRRGRGGSGDADVYELEREIEDVAAVVESIDGPVTLLGHSYGALIALEAADRIDTLRGLVLYEPSFTPEEGAPEVEQLLGAIQSLLADGEKEQALVADLNAVGMAEAYIEELRSNPSWQELVDAADTLPHEFEQIIEYEFDTDRFRGMTTPTLLFAGGESPPGLIDVTETVDETLPDSRSVRIDGEAHFGLISKADHFVEEVLAFRHESN